GRREVETAAAAERLRQEGFAVDHRILDVTDDNAIKDLAAYLERQYGRVDVLVNNAGAFFESAETRTTKSASALDTTRELLLKSFNNNAASALLVAAALVPLMRKHNYGRIVNVSSGMGALTDMNGQWPGYRLSKTALNAVTRVLADELKDTNIKINSVCPGWVRTDMGGSDATRSIKDGADTIIWAATLPDDGASGGFFRDRKPVAW
ncbi:MAG TPA: SDR family NAD(P)-dependent oxidoreductase, partial [Burkholderiaceae bacterium]|nr:SDR family NAD(P)-dependent oxidoreductase [Burkholderiaceae bacterium]